MKIGRNAPCPCGSGRKYKRCCGKERRAATFEPDCELCRLVAESDLETFEVEMPGGIPLTISVLPKRPH